jgi:hypothetical protein
MLTSVYTIQRVKTFNCNHTDENGQKIQCTNPSRSRVKSLCEWILLIKIIIRSIGLWQWYINITITILDIFHCTVVYLKHDVSCRYLKQMNVNKIYRFLLRCPEIWIFELHAETDILHWWKKLDCTKQTYYYLFLWSEIERKLVFPRAGYHNQVLSSKSNLR